MLTVTTWLTGKLHQSIIKKICRMLGSVLLVNQIWQEVRITLLQAALFA
jgi:hypothetical protein